jgi:hypothetical protein
MVADEIQSFRVRPKVLSGSGGAKTRLFLWRKFNLAAVLWLGCRSRCAVPDVCHYNAQNVGSSALPAVKLLGK